MSPTTEIATTPSGVQIVYYDKSHRYKIGRTTGVVEKYKDAVPVKEELRWVPSVSTILDKALSKNLTGWAERLTTSGITQLGQLKGWDYLARLGPDAILAELHAAGLRYYQNRDAAAARGTNVHKAFELLSEGKVPNLKDWPLEQRGYIQAIARWWSEFNPDVIASELMVASWDYQYAGRMDLLARLAGEVVVIDLKTSRAIRESHHYQTAGYRLAARESGHGPCMFGWILRVADDGTFEFVCSHATTRQWKALVASYQSQKEFETEGKALLKAAA